jgi:hypothetical protein
MSKTGVRRKIVDEFVRALAGDSPSYKQAKAAQHKRESEKEDSAKKTSKPSIEILGK